MTRRLIGIWLIGFPMAAVAADLPAEDRFLASDSVVVGLNEDGSLINSDLALGLLFDPDGPTGKWPLGADILVAGHEYEGWLLTHADGELFCASPYVSCDQRFDWSVPDWTDSATWMEGSLETDLVTVHSEVVLSLSEPVLWLDLKLSPVVDLTDVQVARFLDPDFDAYITGSYDTLNTASDGWAAAESLADGRALALATVGGTGGICDWCTTSEGIAEGGEGASTGDDQIGVTVAVGDIGAGETVTVRFAYGFGENATDALVLAQWATETDDRDADGVAEGKDCDDLNAAKQTDCDEEKTEDPGDVQDGDTAAWPPEVPQDEGVTVTTTEVESGCQTAAAGTGLWWVLLGLWRRRR